MKTQRPSWYLRAYEKSGDFPVFVYRLDNIKVEELQSLFSESSYNPMYDCYPVTESQVECLQGRIKHKIDLKLYDYYVECEADD